ncbi:MAG: hypothetical protein V3W11_07485 [bacterium]
MNVTGTTSRTYKLNLREGPSTTSRGEIDHPCDVAVWWSGARAYVADAGNHRIQYFENRVVVNPTSLGRVRALFR